MTNPEQEAREIVNYFADEYTECNCDDFFCLHMMASLRKRITSFAVAEYRRGRGDGIEDAAKIVDQRVGGHRTMEAIKNIAANIRALVEEQKQD